MPRLSLALLGPLEATLDGKSISGLSSGKAWALLAYLAVESDRAHTREALAEFLWPDYPSESAFASLRNVLALLRCALGEQAATTPFLLVTRDTLQFNRGSDHWLDVRAFGDLLAPKETGEALVGRLEQAAALHRDQFLAGFAVGDSPAFDEWLTLRRHEYSRQALLTLQRLAAARESSSDLASAEGFVRRQLAIEPWREEAHRELMRLLALSGQRSAALAQYEVCERALKAHLDVELDRETVSLYQRIREGKVGPESRVLSPEASTTPTTRDSGLSTQHSVRSARGPFVARDRELAWLDRHLAETLAGRGRVAFVVGEAGSGKTVLLSEFARRAMHSHGDLLVAMGNSNAHTGLGDPYLTFREVLQMLAGDVEAKRAGESLTPEHARRLWALLPETLQALVESGPDLVDLLVPGQPLLARAQAVGPPTSSSHSLARLEKLLQRRPARPPAALQQNDLFEQVTRVLHQMAKRRTLVIVLDDLQWADRGSVSLLFHLGRRLAGSRILLLGGYRSSEVAAGRGGERHPLEPVVHELGRDFGEVLLDLDQVEGRRFVGQFLDSEPNRLGEPFREMLYRLTAGHALFTVELLRGLEERGDLVRDEGGRLAEGPNLDWGRLPARVEAVIAERIGRLPQEQQALLEAAAVEGEEFTVEVAARVVGTEEERVTRLLSGPLGREHRLVSAVSLERLGGHRLSRYRFRHHLFQHYLYGRLDEVERARFHEAVGTALEELYGERAKTERAVELARHFEQAGMVDKALDYLLLAGNTAVRLSANAEAVEDLTRGLSLLARLPPSPERDRRELELRLAAVAPLWLLRGWGSPGLAKAVARARELAESLGEMAGLQAVLGLLAFAAIGQGRLVEAIALGEQLLSLAERSTDREWLSAAHRLAGLARLIRGDLVLGHEQIERAMALYDPESERSLDQPLSTTLVVLCLQYDEPALWMLGYPDQSWRRGEEALAVVRGAGELDLLGLPVAAAAYTRLMRRQYEPARELIEVAERSVAEKDDARLATFLAVPRGRLLVKDGQVESGLALMRQGVEGWRATGTVPHEVFQLEVLAEGCLEAGQVDLGLAAVGEWAELAKKSDARSREAEFHRLEGELLLRGGRDSKASEAESCFGRALEVARKQEAKSYELRAAMSLARLWQRRGRQQEARELLAPVYNWFTEGFDTPDLVDARRLLAELLTDTAPKPLLASRPRSASSTAAANNPSRRRSP